MKWLSIILAMVVNVAACGGRVLVPSCPDAGVGCWPPEQPQAASYCCDEGYVCCELDGHFGCCQGDVPDATPF